ncbi:MAG: hypothetical protein HY303_04510 [Candidatus Wallbacteria bacterium]|nr:hypothetical protein [Candidatus Wallbacteria bacterium]
MSVESQSKYVVAVVGGAVSGAEAAATLADRGIEVVVLEQNLKPYGKIEDGLPRWHDKQRAQEYERINSKLTRPGVHFVPGVKLGRDLGFEELARQWGFSAVLLANGAWKDRPVGLDGLDDYVGKGLVYQNPLVYWFNHYHEKGYDGPTYEIEDDCFVLGGGLASYDVVKIVMLELAGKALRSRGHNYDMLTLEHKGIAAILAQHGLTLSDLGVKGCTLYYRRRALDMPVAAYKENATLEERKKTEEVRERLLQNAMSKFLFRFEPLHLPVGFLLENGRLAGLRFIRTEIKDGKVIQLKGTEVERRTTQVISSIGSIPEPLPGVPQKGEFYIFAEGGAAKLTSFDNVFGVGNVVTGKGNIAVSRKHSAGVADVVARDYLKVPAPVASDTAFGKTEQKVHGQTASVADAVQQLKPMTSPQRESLFGRVRELQKKAGYDGDFRAWIKKVSPPDMD